MEYVAELKKEKENAQYACSLKRREMEEETK